MTTANDIWNLLTSHGKLERDKGIDILKDLCDKAHKKDNHQTSNDYSLPPGDLIRDLFVTLVQFPITAKENPWETKIGILMGCQVLIEANASWPSSEIIHLSSDTGTHLRQSSIVLLSDEEVRVRIAAGDLLGALGKKYGVSVYEDTKETILHLIKTNLEREESNGDSDKSIVESSTHHTNGSTKQIFHETAGWRHLETSMKCLQSVVNGCGSAFKENIDTDLLDLINVTTKHTNRFVRETGYHTLASIIDAATARKNDTNAEVFNGMDIDNNLETELHTHDEQIMTIHNIKMATILADGLSDNWSQVRLSAAVATRSFLTSLPKDSQAKHAIYSLMIPRLCLNRYYLAEGVRIYSQETWRMVTNPEIGGGKKVVEAYIEDVVKYYTLCTIADNHAVREAACQCIAELAAKLDKTILEPQVDLLLDTLLECFNDDSWPVRDMACVAAGKFVFNFPNQSKRSLDKLIALFFTNLHDSIASVRQGAALAISNLAIAYESDESITIVDDILSKVKQNLDGMSNQPSEAKKFTGLDTNSLQSNFGVAKRIRDNDPDLHTDQTMYSCGSLAPKMKGSRSSGGCSDCKFQKESEPWESADGSVLLLCELSNTEGFRDKIIRSNLIQKISDACRYRHYVSHHCFLETVMKTLPIIGGNLGKRTLKMYLEEFMDHIFYTAECENALASSAAYNCLKNLSDILGPNIMRGRVEQFHPRYLTVLDAAITSFQGPNMGEANGAKFTPISMSIPIPISNKQPSLGGTPTGSPIKH